ncbi:MAG: Fe-S cluster assembly protein SufD [Solirubrobacteraceae bacterium]
MASATAEPELLAARRARAAQLTRTLELPTHRTPGWEFTDVTGLDLADFGSSPDGDAAERQRAEAIFEPVAGGRAIDQVDGLTVTDGVEPVPGEALVLPLAEAAARFPELVEPHLGSVVASEDVFVASNEAAFTAGVFVHVPRHTVLEAPVLLTAIQAAAGTALNWRLLIVLEEGAQAEVWEQYLSAEADAEGLFNTIVEIVVGAGANLRYVCGQSLSERSWIFGSQRAEVQRDGSLDWVALGLGSARGKVRMETKLAGAGSSAKVTGAYTGHGRQHLDFDTTQEHAAPNTVSDLAFRGLLNGRSTAVWRGMIRVDPGAQQTDAFQECRNLLLSKRAHADAIPGLEIEANDVRCTHAAAIAQIDPEQLYYLQSRGIPEAMAKRLVIEGFLQELVERFPEGPIHAALSSALERRLNAVLGV